MRFFALGEFSLCPETHFKDIFKFKGGLIAVCGLDHSGSQPFNCYAYILYAHVIKAQQRRVIVSAM